MFTATVLVSPKVMVCGSAGTGCSRGRSCSSMSAGTRFVVRCTRPLTVVMNAVHAASRSAKQRVLLGQVGVGGDDVGLRQFHGVLHAALAGRVPHLAGVHGHAVEPGERHDLLVPHRDPRDMLDRHGLLVIGQDIGRGTAQQPERRVQGGEHRRDGPVPQRDDDPEPATTPATRRTAPSCVRR